MMPRKATKPKKPSRRELDREAAKLSDMELVDESLRADRAVDEACAGPFTDPAEDEDEDGNVETDDDISTIGT